jgi:hypothetical protein
VVSLHQYLGHDSKHEIVGKNINRPYLVIFADFTDQIGKCLVHVNSLLSRGLNKATPEMLSKVTTLCAMPWRREMRHS